MRLLQAYFTAWVLQVKREKGKNEMKKKESRRDRRIEGKDNRKEGVTIKEKIIQIVRRNGGFGRKKILHFGDKVLSILPRIDLGSL